MSRPQVVETLEEAFSSGTLVRKDGGVVCACSPAKRFKAGCDGAPRRLTVRNVPKRSRWTPEAGTNEVDQNSAEVCRFYTFRHVPVLKTFLSTHTQFDTFAPTSVTHLVDAAESVRTAPLRGGQAPRSAPKLAMVPWPAAASSVRESASRHL